MTKSPEGIDLVVLCGGRGVRMRPTTDRIPKGLVPVAGRPIIDHVLDSYLKQGIQRAFLCVGYKGDSIRSHIESRNLSSEIIFSDMGETASMLERLHVLTDQLSDTFAVAYCDTFIDLNFTDMLQAHKKGDYKATMLTAHIQSPFGIVDINEDGNVISFIEKPVLNYFVGCFLMNRVVLENLNKNLVTMPDGAGIVQLFQQQVRDRTLNSYQNDGLRITFNTETERNEAEKKMNRYFTLNEEAAK